MDQELLNRFQAILDDRQNEKSNERFKITHYDEATIKELLMKCFKSEVIKRGMEFIKDDNTQQNISKAAKWLTGDYKVGLMLYGGVGNGKTTLARSIIELISILYNTRGLREPGFVNVSALELSKMIIEAPNQYQKVKEAEKIFIDDMGTEPTNVKSWGNELSPVTELLYYRYDKQLFTLITSNFNDAQIEERYGVRISDRFSEMFDKAYFPGKSYRK